MKILNVIGRLSPLDGGPTKTCPELAGALAERGNTVDIYTTNMDGDHELQVPVGKPVEFKGAHITYFPIGKPRFWAFSYGLAKALSRDVPKYDIVHIYSFYAFHGLATGYYCRQYKIPYILQPHGALDPYLYHRHRFRKYVAEWCYENRNIRGANAILFNSEEERRLALPFIDHKPQLVVPLGLHVQDYRPVPDRGSFRSRYPHLNGKKIFLFLSRINFKKGIDLLVKAFARLLQSRQDIHLFIAGPDNEGYGDLIRQWCQEAGITSHVTFTGMLSETDKRAILVDADLFVLPSYTENFGVTILEAMVCGTPVLISDQVNIWREIVEGGAGEAVPCEVGKIAERMQSLLARPDLLKQMGERGKALVEEKFRWESVARLQEEAYESVLTAHSGVGVL